LAGRRQFAVAECERPALIAFDGAGRHHARGLPGHNGRTQALARFVILYRYYSGAAVIRKCPADSEGLVDTVHQGQAERVVVVSLLKSGAHLLQELMVALDYKMCGTGLRVRPDVVPILDDDTRWRIARLAYDKQTVATLEVASREEFVEATDRAWDALGWSWAIRLAQPVHAWYSREMVDSGFVEQVHRRSVGTDFAETPAGVCWVVNQFDITQIDGHFLNEWSQTGSPKILFNYRDPRDAVVSMVNFLCERTGKGYADYHTLPPFSRILKSMATVEEQVAYALTDPTFPGRRDLEHMRWLYNHPDVCKTSFEELVGPKGGGTAEAQARALERIFKFLGVTDVKSADVTARLYNPDSWTFYRGQIGGWRKVFTPELQRLADEQLGDLIKDYGYQQ
jgi:hypothetical protein